MSEEKKEAIPEFPLSYLKVKGYKCFVKEQDYQGFENIKPINIIIGKNNSGKSRLIEIIKEYRKLKPDITFDKFEFDFQIGFVLSASHILSNTKNSNRIAQSKGIRGATSQQSDYNLLWQYILGKWFLVSKNLIDRPNNLSIPIHVSNDLKIEKVQQYAVSKIKNPYLLSKYHIREVTAERDIGVENSGANSTKVNFQSNGKDFTTLIDSLLRNTGHTDKERFLENDFLNTLNDIVGPDIKFNKIKIKEGQHLLPDGKKNGGVQIFLQEDGKDKPISLSDSGSGLKTIFLVLANLHLIPMLENQPVWQYIYCFEELENNLHPAIEKRLLNHIKNFVKENGCHVFLTTHSHYPIDIFKDDEDSQILNVENKNGFSTVKKVDTWDKRVNLLDDMGVKASDILQSNYIIWCEGPSDRIYINKWIELFNSRKEEDKKLRENIHYQFLYTAGSCLSSLGINDLDKNTLDNFIDILKINKNFCVFMDSDKDSSRKRLKTNVRRIKSELDNLQDKKIHHFITRGREVENYIPDVVIQEFFNSDKVKLGQYERFEEIYKKQKKVKTFNKTDFAKKIIKMKSYNVKNLEKHLNLKKDFSAIIKGIKKANGL